MFVSEISIRLCLFAITSDIITYRFQKNSCKKPVGISGHDARILYL